MSYKFLPYTPTSKVDCPYCGHKKCFVRYVDTDSGEIMDTEFGRCDREESCRYNKHPLSGIQQRFMKSEIQERRPQQYIDKNIVLDSMKFNDQNQFLILLANKFGEDLVSVAMKKYFIGTSKKGGTGYYCIDHRKLVTSCKVITYDGFNRDKSVMPYYPWKTTDGYYPCLFGMHLVDKNKKLKLVESEKTAFVASILYPEVVWVSCGGSNNLTHDKCKLLKEVKYPHVIDLIPDCDQAGRNATLKWQENLSIVGIDSHVIDLGAEYTNGEDLADLLLM